MNTQNNPSPISSLNRVTLIGNIGKDAELIKTGDKQYCRLAIATSEQYIAGGIPKEVTTWHNITLWDRQADYAVQHLKKGTKVLLDGKMVARTYEDKDGKSVYVYEIKCNAIELYQNSEMKKV